MTLWTDKKTIAHALYSMLLIIFKMFDFVSWQSSRTFSSWDMQYSRFYEF